VTEENDKDEVDFAWSDPPAPPPPEEQDTQFSDLGDSPKVFGGEAQSVEPED
jgi:hypothetical protein